MSARIFLFEFASSSGLLSSGACEELFPEGFAMLRTLASDFSKAGFEVVVALDEVLIPISDLLEVDEVQPVRSGSYLGRLEEICKTCDLAYVIAPETWNLLAKLVRRVEKTCKTLNCEVKAITATGDKWETFRRLREGGVSTPDTSLVTPGKLGGLVFPCVVKPVDGVGCAGLSLASNPKELEYAVKVASRQSAYRHVLCQRYLPGRHLSVNLLVGGGSVEVLTVNTQEISLNPPGLESSYNGCLTPVYNGGSLRVAEEAGKAVKLFKGLKGYVGVDVVYAGGKAYIIEVNPRLTTSYVASRLVLNVNIAEQIYRCVFFDEKPSKPSVEGIAFLGKVKAPVNLKVGVKEVRDLLSQEFVVSTTPPTGRAVKKGSEVALITGRALSYREALFKRGESEKAVMEVLGV